VIKKVWRSVKVDGHDEQVIAALRELLESNHEDTKDTKKVAK